MKNIFIYLLVGTIFFACSSKEVQTNNNQQTLDVQLDKLVNQIINSLSENNKVKVGIVEFSDIQGNSSNLGKYIAEELTTRLYRTDRFNVVERQMMDKLLKEQNLSTHGYIDINSETGIGKVLGIDAIVSGSITDLGAYIKINARLISPESAKVFSVASVKIIKDDTIKMLLNQKTESSKIAISGIKTGSQNVIEKEGVLFELIDASINGRTITVQIKLTNTTEDDIDFQITYGWQYKTKIFDNNGNETVISSVKYGSQLKKIDGLSQYSSAAKKLIAGNSINMKLNFDNASSKTTKITLLQMLWGNKRSRIEFRDIPIKK
jgi:TolB-like protein